jgi:hypothetical protein
MDTVYAELEVGLHRVQAETYQIELRYTDPASAAETSPRRGRCPLDPQGLLPLLQDPKGYGQALADQVFADPEIRAYLRQVKAAVEAAGQFLRLRLLIGPTAPGLHALRWELLADPDTGAPFATSERVLFSRFMLSQDWRTVRLRPKAALRALVAVSAPSDLGTFGLAEIDAEAETRRAQDALSGIELAVAGLAEPLTIEHLDRCLRRGVDLCYLVAHGALRPRDGPFLALQGPDGRAKWIRGEVLAERIAEMRDPPRLMVLASCEGAGQEGETGTDLGATSAQAALAPRLANAGVPAIVAAQGRVSLATVATAMPRFFTELLQDGRIDRAMAVARGLVRGHPDAWVPALYLRLRGGRIWYDPGFGASGGQGDDDAIKWSALVNDIQSKRCTPVIGCGLAEGVYGSIQDLALRLAAASHFPLAPYQRTDLPQVAQYLLVTQRSSTYPLEAVKEQMSREIIERHRELLTPEDREAKLSKLLKKVGAAMRSRNHQDPVRLLATLPVRVFVTAAPDNLLVDALKEAGKTPEERCAFWKRGLAPPEPYEGEPTVAAPLVYHMLGHFKEPDSLVLTQDDYIEYLIGVSLNKGLVPRVVRHALTNSSLMFLGFQLTDWNFRILFRLIMTQESSALRQRYPHAAVQVDPEGTQLINPEKARRYLLDCYGSEHISLFWGGSDEFLRQLRPRLEERTPSEWDREGEDGNDF